MPRWRNSVSVFLSAFRSAPLNQLAGEAPKKPPTSLVPPTPTHHAHSLVLLLLLRRLRFCLSRFLAAGICVEPILSHLYYTSTTLHQKSCSIQGWIKSCRSKVLPRYPTLQREKKSLSLWLLPGIDVPATCRERYVHCNVAGPSFAACPRLIW